MHKQQPPFVIELRSRGRTGLAVSEQIEYLHAFIVVSCWWCCGCCHCDETQWYRQRRRHFYFSCSTAQYELYVFWLSNYSTWAKPTLSFARKMGEKNVVLNQNCQAISFASHLTANRLDQCSCKNRIAYHAWHSIGGRLIVCVFASERARVCVCLSGSSYSLNNTCIHRIPLSVT